MTNFSLLAIFCVFVLDLGYLVYYMCLCRLDCLYGSVTLLSGGTVSKAVAIAVTSALVDEGQFSTPVACQLSGLGPLVCIQAAPIVISC